MTKFSCLVFVCFIACSLHFTAASQSLSVNTSGAIADPSAILDVSSTAKGMLIPRMTKAQKNAIATPATGLLIFQNAPDSIGFHYYNGTNWLWLATASGSQGWLTTGNTGTDSAINFLGTLDNKPLMLRQNNLWMGQLNTSNHNYFIGAGSGFNNTGQYNTAVGDSALFNNTTANQNTAIGAYALRNDATGIDNVAVGYQSSFLNDTASRNTSVGREALYYNKTNGMVAVGYRAGWYSGAAAPFFSRQHTSVGTEAGLSNFEGDKITAVGFRAYSNYNSATNQYWANNIGRNTAIGDSAMAYTPGAYNVAVGTEALSRAFAASRNVSIGDSSMGNAFNANDNVGVGYKTLSQVRNQGNIAMGAYAGQRLSNTVWNTAIGYHALENDTTGSQNTVMGTSSFRNLTNGTNNVGVGINTGFNVTSSNNTFMGSFAGEGAAGLSTGGSNTGVGYFALSDIQSGANNTAFGRDALRDDTSGSYNVAVGLNSMQSNLASDYNTAVGYNSLTNHKRTGFTYNTAVGASALEQDSSGFQNTGVGVSALRINKTGFYNTGVGINAGYYQKESYNTFIGAYSGVGERLNLANVTADTGNYNTGLGAYSMWRIANGSNNVALGYSAMYNDSSGNLNTAVGNGALYSNTGSHNNQAFGYNALFSYNHTSEGWNNAFGDRAAEDLTNGTQNVVMGSWAFLGHNSGSFNTVVGNSAMGNGLGLGGSNNSALGNASLYNTTGTGNTAVGNNAGDGITTGTFNTLLGYNADVTSPNLTNATAVGYNASVAQSNSLVLGASGTNVGINETSPNARLHIVRSGVSGGTFHASSSAIIEDNTSSYLQFSNPNSFETGFLSGNALTTIRSAIIFRADSSIQIRSGGNTARIIIDNTGFVGIGNAAPAELLHVGVTTGATVRIGSAETLEDFGGTLLATNSNFVPTLDNARTLGNTTNRWSAVWAVDGTINTSDAREKENISNLNYGLNEIMKLRPVSFNWKENPQWGRKIGFLAQEVQPILSEVVQVGDLESNAPSKDADGISSKAASDKLGIYYSDIIPVTVKAIQEQQQTIEQQQQQIEELKKKNEQLQKDIQKIKSKIGINN